MMTNLNNNKREKALNKLNKLTKTNNKKHITYVILSKSAV